MSTQILDEELIQKEVIPVGKNWKNYLALSILWIGNLTYICLFLLAESISDIRVLFTSLFLVGATIVTYKKFDAGVKFTFCLILLGVFHILLFFPIYYTFSFRVGSAMIVIDLILTLIGLVHYFTNKEILSPYFERIMNKKDTEEEVQLRERTKVNRYKHQFRNRNLKELNEIVNNERLLPEANEAAKELINEKSNFDDN